jgi:hypothetical protein
MLVSGNKNTILVDVKYSGDLNTGLVQNLNGKFKLETGI